MTSAVNMGLARELCEVLQRHSDLTHQFPLALLQETAGQMRTIDGLPDTFWIYITQSGGFAFQPYADYVCKMKTGIYIPANFQAELCIADKSSRTTLATKIFLNTIASQFHEPTRYDDVTQKDVVLKQATSDVINFMVFPPEPEEV